MTVDFPGKTARLEQPYYSDKALCKQCGNFRIFLQLKVLRENTVYKKLMFWQKIREINPFSISMLV